MDEDTRWQRKWASFFLFCTLVSLGFVATIKWEAAQAEYATYGGLLLAGLSVYFGANIGNKWTVRRGKGITVGAEHTTTVNKNVTASAKAIELDEGPPPKPK